MGQFLLCIPLRIGVFMIVMMQMMYASARIYISAKSDNDNKGMYFYLDFTGHIMGLFAAVLLFLGVLFEKRNFLLPWVGMSIVNPGLFLISLSFDLLFFNFSGASWLILNDGIPSVIMLYLIYTVYSLYLEMGDCNNVAVNDAEQAVSVSDTVYGTGNVIWLTESSSSVSGSSSEPPPAYDSLVEVHKQHVQT